MFGKAAIVWHARTVPERRGAILLCCTARHGLGGEARRREEQKNVAAPIDCLSMHHGI